MKPFFLVFALGCCFVPVSSQLFAGAPIPGDGGLQIYFSDDGLGGTAVTATGTGRTDDDDQAPANSGNALLGFSEGIDVDSLDPDVPAALASLEDIAKVEMSDPIAFTWTGLKTVTYERFDIGIGDRKAVVFESKFDFINVPSEGAEMTVADGNGTIPLPYSTFAAVHGMSFPTTDGFTFVFESSAASRADACADKSQLLRKIKKLKKMLKKAKRTGNNTKAGKLNKKLKKLKKRFKRLC